MFYLILVNFMFIKGITIFRLTMSVTLVIVITHLLSGNVVIRGQNPKPDRQTALGFCLSGFVPLSVH